MRYLRLSLKLILILMILVTIPGLRAEPEIYSPIKITDRVYILYANVGVVIGDDYVTLIDNWLGFYQEGAAERLVAEVKKLTDNPIRYVINTHSHGDHSGANQYFVDHGATVIAHKNAIYSSFVAKTGQPKGIVRFSDSFNLDTGSEQFKIEHVIAHTFDDAFVYLEKDNLLFVGDNFTSRFWVGLGVFGLESFELWTDRALAIMNEKTLIVPGHGATLIDKKQLLTHIRIVKEWVARAKQLYLAGKSAEEMTSDPLLRGLYQDMVRDQGSRFRELEVRTIKKLIAHELQPAYQLAQNQLSLLVGTYTYEDRNEIEIFLLKGKLVARQKDKFFSYLKPLNLDVFELINTNGGELFVLTKDVHGVVQGLTPSIPQESRNQSLKTGLWKKLSR